MSGNAANGRAKKHRDCIEVVTNYKTGISVEVLFSRPNKDFFCKVGDKEIRATEAKECIRLAQEALDKFKPFVWTPKIRADSAEMASYQRDWRIGVTYDVQFHFEFTRFEITPRFMEDGFLQRPHALDADLVEVQFTHVMRHAERDDPKCWATYHEPGDGEFEVDYDQNLWDALMQVRQNCDALREKLKDLLDPKTKGRLLIQAAARMQPLLGNGKTKGNP